MAKRSTSKPERIDTGRSKMVATRDVQGRFKDMDEVGRSRGTDRRGTAKPKVKCGPPGQN